MKLLKKQCLNGLNVQKIADYLTLKNVQIPCKIGAQVYLTLFLFLTQTVLPKVATTKLKSSNVMLTVTKISNASETVFYIFFLINALTNKQPPDGDCSYSKSILF